MLSAIRHFLSDRASPVSLAELARHFDTREEVMDGMLSHWLRKGQLLCRKAPPCQKACGGCDQALHGQLWYQWKAPSQRKTSAQAGLIPLVQVSDASAGGRAMAGSAAAG
ncbi:MAG: FeoC-like transcriptional regulator [Kistimonas sp.]|nr:FeoC-like transcriptional regulator [Kistimonas sp.]